MSSSPVIEASVFKQALDDFRKTLSPEDQNEMQFTTLEHLQECILDIQREQINGRAARNINRLAPFLDAMGQYQTLIEVFLNASSILCFVWVR
jgi:hypothetical protein